MPEPTLTISRRLYSALRRELAARSGGVRESGAFLLTRTTTTTANGATTPRRVDAIAYYDDLDPASLTGGITFTAAGYSALGARCRAEGLRVVADIHTHPERWVKQSGIDASHPMTAIPGHIAVIAPHFAQNRFKPKDCGVHRFRGASEWDSFYGNAAAEQLRLTGMPTLRDVLDAVRASLRKDRRR